MLASRNKRKFKLKDFSTGVETILETLNFKKRKLQIISKTLIFPIV